MDAALYRPKISSFFYSTQQGNDQVNFQNTVPLQSNWASTGQLEEPSDPSATAGKWAARILRECAKAVSDNDTERIHHHMWMLNELGSPYGDCDQKLASHFLQALFCKATGAGERCCKILTSIAEKNHSFERARKVILKFQEVSPWTTFGHVASNGAILEALEGETKLHIIDISNTYCTQWPTLLEALATRSDETPRLRLTVVVTTSTVESVMQEIGQRMVKFARLMGVPFEFHVVSGLARLSELTKEKLGIHEDEAIAVNCIGALRKVSIEERGSVVQMLRSIGPRVVTVVEDEADFTSCRGDFLKCFEECLRFYSLFFEMLEESFVPSSNERLMLERRCSRNIVSVLACDGESGEGSDMKERGIQWCGRVKEAFSPAQFSDDAIDDVKALLKRYRSGWSIGPAEGEDDHGLYLKWKEEVVVWASAWKP